MPMVETSANEWVERIIYDRVLIIYVQVGG